MPVQLYETMFLLDSSKNAIDPEESKASIHGVIEKHGGEIVVSKLWDERKLAYPIRRNNITHKKGVYHIIYYKIESSKQPQLDPEF